MGDPLLQHLRLAAPVLPDGRLLRGHLQGVDRGDRLVGLRSRPQRRLRQLHGSLRLRADRGACDNGLAQAVAAGADLAVISREFAVKAAPRAAPKAGEISEYIPPRYP